MISGELVSESETVFCGIPHHYSSRREGRGDRETERGSESERVGGEEEIEKMGGVEIETNEAGGDRERKRGRERGGVRR